jgi:hypothetical protein
MSEITLAQELAFVIAQRQQDEATILAQAVREGIRTLYREALIEACLADRISRQDALKQLRPEVLEEIEYQRDALQCDVAWGMGNE